MIFFCASAYPTVMKSSYRFFHPTATRSCAIFIILVLPRVLSCMRQTGFRNFVGFGHGLGGRVIGSGFRADGVFNRTGTIVTITLFYFPYDLRWRGKLENNENFDSALSAFDAYSRISVFYILNLCKLRNRRVSEWRIQTANCSGWFRSHNRSAWGENSNRRTVQWELPLRCLSRLINFNRNLSRQNAVTVVGS